MVSITANNSTWVDLDGTLNMPNCALTTGNLYTAGCRGPGVNVYRDVSVRQRL